MDDMKLIATGEATINTRGEVVTFGQWQETADERLVELGFYPVIDHGKKGYHAADIEAMRYADEVHAVDSGIDPKDECCNEEADE